MTRSERDEDAVQRWGTLADPVRRRLYDLVMTSAEPVGREEAARAVGISRTLAAYHLDKLAEAGLLQTGYARPEGRTGPGSGRPAKLYRLTDEELAVSVPPRSYPLLARLLADAVAADPSGAVRAAVEASAAEEGRAAGSRIAAGTTEIAGPVAPHADTPREAGAAPGEADGADVAEDELLALLLERGYAPVVTKDGSIEMRNCPFHRLARHDSPLVCGLNHALLSGVLEGCHGDPRRAELSPAPGRCCVVIHPSTDAAAG